MTVAQELSDKLECQCLQPRRQYRPCPLRMKAHGSCGESEKPKKYLCCKRALRNWHFISNADKKNRNCFFVSISNLNKAKTTNHDLVKLPPPLVWYSGEERSQTGTLVYSTTKKKMISTKELWTLWSLKTCVLRKVHLQFTIITTTNYWSLWLT